MKNRAAPYDIEFCQNEIKEQIEKISKLLPEKIILELVKQNLLSEYSIQILEDEENEYLEYIKKIIASKL